MAKASHFSEDPPQGKRVVFGIAAIPILSALLFLIFRDEYPQIKSCLSRLSLCAVLVLLALGILYELTDAKIMQVMVRRTLPSFSFSEAVEVTYLGLFGTIAV